MQIYSNLEYICKIIYNLQLKIMNNTMQTFHTDTATLHFSKMGSGQPLLFIPGSISDHRTWTNIQYKFTENYECYNISRRFQYPGSYPNGGDSSVDSNTSDIAHFINDKKLSPAIIAVSYTHLTLPTSDLV